MHIFHHRRTGLAGAIVSLLFAAPLALSGGATAQPSGAPGQPIQITWTSGKAAPLVWYRQDQWYTNAQGIRIPVVGPARNVAAIIYKGRNGLLDGYAQESDVKHAERILAALAREKGIDPDSVEAVISEYQFCGDSPGMPNCAAYVPEEFPGAKMYYVWPYGDTQAQRALDRIPHDKAIKDLYNRIRRGENVLDAPPSCSGEGNDVERAPRATTRVAGGACGPAEDPEDGALPSELSDPAAELDPGGVDFSSLQLQYMSLSGPNGSDVQYAMSSDGAPATTDPTTGLQTAHQDSDAFFTWLTLPTSSFWVALSPNYPPSIIDPRFALTDAGHVLLESDLLLKETYVADENPATPAGLQLWQRMQALPPGSNTNPAACISSKVTIRPAVATVHATKTQLYILNAPLEVTMEPFPPPKGKLLATFCHNDAYITAWDAAFRQLILPELTQQVNTEPQFEALRRVYMSRVAAQWVRQEAGPNTVMGRLVDSGLHRNWIARPAWSAYALWQQFLQRLKTPTYYSFPVPDGGTTVNESLPVYGGVNFNYKVREKQTSNRQFKARWRGLAAAAAHSSKHPSTADGTTLIGGGMTARHPTPSRQPKPMRVPHSAVVASTT